MLKKKLPYIAAGLLIMMFVINGCGGSDAKPSDPRDPTLSLVFGYIDMEDAPTTLEWVMIKRYKPKPQYLGFCRVEKGMFWHYGISNGLQRVERFSTGSNYYEPIAGTGIRIKKPGIYFMGAYKYKSTKKGAFFSGDGARFRMIRIKSPSEKNLLKRLLKEFKSDKKKFYRQIKMVKRRLRELR